ncbi:TSUP family transporter [Blastococcus sp. SYSU DS0541]
MAAVGDVLPVDLLPEGISGGVLLLLLVAALTAGWIDAVVGGGGLVQLPALLLVPGISPVEALATNKLASIFGTTTSAVTFQRRVRPDLRTALPMALVALAGSFAGASVAAALPASVFKPVIVVALVAIAAFTLLRPSLGEVTALRHAGRRHHGVAAALGVAIGFYDGILGPGTGSFLVFAMVSLLGYDFLHASAKAKIVNVATNLGALLFFAPIGAVFWGLGILMGAANMLGGYLGSRTATTRGSGFIRVVFLVVVTALIGRLGWDVWEENLRPLLG